LLQVQLSKQQQVLQQVQQYQLPPHQAVQEE
jgi:hypothetical protein